MWPVRYRTDDLDRVDRAAAGAGLEAPRRFRIAGWTDPALAVLAGLPTVSLLSLHENGFTNYHLPSDTAANVDWASVDACVALADVTVRSFAGRLPGPTN